MHYGDADGFLIFENNLDALGASWVFLEPIERLTPRENSPKIWDELQALLARSQSPNDLTIPVVAGYIGYELMHTLEDIECPLHDELGTPIVALYRYRTVVKIPAEKKEPILIYQNSNSQPLWEAHGLNQIIVEAQSLPLAASPRGLSLKSLELALAPHSNFSRERYCQAVNKIRELIGAGEVYQVNLSQQLSMPFSQDPRDLFKHLRSFSPVRYGAYFRINEELKNAFSIISGSPELFLSYNNGRLLSSPIKGTRPRGNNFAQDELLKEDLLFSTKDNSELAMIVDLIRNDLGKVSALGSIEVTAHARLESYATLHHLVSDVSSQLSPGKSIIEAIKALFPCGSITGAPKIAAMKYISQLEGCTRGVYTGTFGAFSSDGSAQLNVAIRTATAKNHRLIFNAGGGVVYDSDPDAEYEETLIKAQGIFLAAELCKKQRPEELYVANI